MPSASPLTSFHQDPLRLACAQAVFHLWREQRGEAGFSIESLEALARPSAAPGTCGVLLAARALAPEEFAKTERRFRLRFGDCRCRDLCDPEAHPCRDRVAFACDSLLQNAPVA